VLGDLHASVLDQNVTAWRPAPKLEFSAASFVGMHSQRAGERAGSGGTIRPLHPSWG
jgi:hypothetical protein